MKSEELVAELEKLAEAGDEKICEMFILEHFTELPEDLQGKALLAFFSEAVEKQAGQVATAQLQVEGLKALDELEQIKTEAAAR